MNKIFLIIISLFISGRVFGDAILESFDDDSVAIYKETIRKIQKGDVELGTIRDNDGNTLIQMEESTDEDKIRFDTGGTERIIIDSNGIMPSADDTYYLGQIASPYKGFKALILIDTTDGKHYKVESISGTLTATALD